MKRLRKVVEGAKSVVDAWIDTTGIGANGQVQTARRTADDKVKIIIDNSIADQNLAAIAQETEYNGYKLTDQSRNNNRSCCVIS